MNPVLFLSHAGADTQEAIELADRIEQSPAAREVGLKVWIDKRSLQPGSSWQEQLERAIDEGSTAFGVYLTASGAENWVRMEIRAALERVIAEGKKGNSYPFIPIIASDARHLHRLPTFARTYQGVSLAEGDGAIQALIAAVLGKAEARTLPLVAEPFMGLNAFDAADAYLFFGREAEVLELVERLKQTNLLLVYGDSGSGKSSLVKAGLVPAFREGQLADPHGPRPDPALWHVLEMRPIKDPFESLIKAASDAAGHYRDVDQRTVQERCSRLRNRKQDPKEIGDLLREAAPRNARVLLVVDQFEELWTQATDQDKRRAFLDGLVALEAAAAAPFVVLTMRRDYLFQTSSHPGLRSLLDRDEGRSRYGLRRMKDEQLRTCIEKPLLLAGRSEDEAGELADEILRDAGDQPGELALVEFALFKTWQQRCKHPSLLDAYKAIGRVEGVLEEAAEEALKALQANQEIVPPGADVEKLAEGLFIRLVSQSAEGGVTRRSASASEFSPEVWRLAQSLATREYNHLLVISEAGVSSKPSRGGAPSP